LSCVDKKDAGGTLSPHQVMRTIVNQYIASNHLLVVGQDDMLPIQKRKHLQQNLHLGSATPIIGCGNHIELVTLVVKLLEYPLAARKWGNATPNIIPCYNGVYLLSGQRGKTQAYIPVPQILVSGICPIVLIYQADPSSRTVFHHIIRIKQYRQFFQFCCLLETGIRTEE